MSGKKWQGYVFSREINGAIIPQRVQNLVIRNFIEKKMNNFILSGTEFNLQDCFMSLRSIIENFDVLDGIVFYSLHMLPKWKKERLKLYELAFTQGVSVSFALEEMTLFKREDTLIIEDLLIAEKFSEKYDFNNGFDLGKFEK